MSKKIIGIIIACFIVFSVFLVPDISFADVNAIDFLSHPVDAIILSVATAIVTISSTLLDMGVSFLNFIISEDFMGMSMAGVDNELITYGWAVVRDIANIVIALAFVIVGLGIILGLDNFKAKKSLPILILIALLINFTPAICGFIIDISNIVIHSFLVGGISADALNIDQALEEVSNQSRSADVLIWSVALAIFCVSAAVICLLYALLFVARYFALWVLIIVSPIAFASKAIPNGKIAAKIFPGVLGWDEWWNRFIEWCMVGIIGGFFLYLGTMLMTSMLETVEFDFLSFSTYFQMALPFVFLYIGYFIALESSAFGAGKAIGYAKAGLTKVKKSRTAQNIKTGTGKVLKRGTGRIAGIGGANKKVASARKSWHNATEKITGDYGAFNATQDVKTKEQQKAYSGRTDDDIKNMWNKKSLGVGERTGLANELIKRGEIKDSMMDEMATLAPHGLDTKGLMNIRPDMASEFGKKDIKTVVFKIKASEAHNISSDALKNREVCRCLTASQGANIYKNGTGEQRQHLITNLEENAKVAKKELESKKYNIEYIENALGGGQPMSAEDRAQLMKNKETAIKLKAETSKLKEIIDQVSK